MAARKGATTLRTKSAGGTGSGLDQTTGWTVEEAIVVVPIEPEMPDPEDGSEE